MYVPCECRSISFCVYYVGFAKHIQSNDSICWLGICGDGQCQRV